MSVISIFGVNCGSESPRTVVFYTVVIRYWGVFCHQSCEFEYYHSFRIRFFPNIAETDSAEHLGPHVRFLNVRH